jgi:hypothetical protein
MTNDVEGRAPIPTSLDKSGGSDTAGEQWLTCPCAKPGPMAAGAKLGIAALAAATAVLAVEPLAAVVAVAAALIGLIVLERLVRA